MKNLLKRIGNTILGFGVLLVWGIALATIVASAGTFCYLVVSGL